jgi:hypothetical protein
MKDSFIRLVLVAAFASLAAVAFAGDRPIVEFGIGAGALDYSIESSFDNPSMGTVTLGGYAVHEYDSSVQGEESYPYSGTPISINTAFLVRLPIGRHFALAYSNRVSFAMDEVIHRADYYELCSETVLTMAGLTGLEAEYYFLEGPSGPWVSVLCGVSVLDQPYFLGNYLFQMGWGAGGTVGWRFSKHLAAELNAYYMGESVSSIIESKVEDAGASVSGSMSGLAISAGLRFGLF